MATLTTDLYITAREISGLTSADAVAGFLTQLGYNTDRRAALTPESIGLAGDSAAAIKSIEVLSEDAEGFLRVVFVQLRSLTAKSRNDLARVLGKTNVDHLMILTSDFSVLEFVLLHKRRRESRGPGGVTRVEVVPLAFAVARKAPATKELRTIRRFTWTCRDGLEQYDKLRSVFEAAAFTEEYFCNRALFADHYLLSRLREDPAWRDNPTQAFAKVKDLLNDARGRWLAKGEQLVRDQLYEPLFELLGFKAKVNKAAGEDHVKPDYLLTAKSGKGTAAAFVYAWERWLDGPDFNLDHETSEENPGACVVSALEQGVADWIIVTNGKVWRLYSRQAHSRATNFYEVDLIEALVASGDTDPNEAFRYWWLFFRADAFSPRGDGQAGCWLDAVAEGSRDYAKRLGERLKERIFVTIFPYLAQGFLEDRKKRLGIRRRPTEDELSDTYEATLTLLYRLLFLLYAEARDLLPIREAPYREASLKKIKEEIAEKAGVAESEVTARLTKAYAADATDFYDRLLCLCEAMDRGAPTLNVPIYNGGLFITKPGDSDNREQRIARYLNEHKVPDRHLALAIDRLARDPDEKTLGLVSIDYKSLEVRHLGSIYEGLLEFKLRVADEDLTTATEKKKEKYIPLGKAKTKRGKAAEAVVCKGDVYLSNDKAERKASGSYYTPDPIVKYIVENTVGPVLDAKLESLRGDLRKVRKTFDRELEKATAYPVKRPSGDTWEPRDFAAEKTYTAHKDLVERLFDFRALDPAMGSGHFLVEAVDFITDRMLAYLNQFPINPVTFMLDRTRRNILEALGEQSVAVDPDKLTEVNLLKRHVLKRCIYGVDLNPMAVELAKVSLWLDAFTIGAPLSFLDHHLRCGNSLIGATFKDLESVTKGQLFSIDYEPLLRAIRHVIHVNAMADATAAEVRESASEYGQARAELAGYQVLLDLVVSGYFDIPDGPELLRLGSEIDVSSHKRFMQSIAKLGSGRSEGASAIQVVERVEALAAEPHLRFFHWEIEFPEVFFEFADNGRRIIKHKDRIAGGSAGFEAIIGNPPYVRMEAIKPLKPFLKPTFSCHSERADLFIYFFEQAVRLSKRGGRSAFIASSTWTKSKAGKGLRAFFKNSATIVSFLDFGDLPVFPEATTYPAVLVVERRPPEPSHMVASALVPDLEDPYLARVLQDRRIDVPQAELEAAGWAFEDRRIARLRQKIRDTGKPLRDYAGPALRGIVSGLTEAFVVDTPTYERLVAADKRSREILKPFLEGKDLKPWRYNWRGLYLIYTHHGIEIDRYPAIKNYLVTYRRRLEERATSDNHEWYELQQPQFAYTSFLAGPKVMWPQITNRPSFSVDVNGFYVNNKVYFIPVENVDSAYYLMAILNSNISWNIITSIATPKLNDYFELFSGVIERIAVPTAQLPESQVLETLAKTLSSNSAAERMTLEAELNEHVAALYGLTAEEQHLIRRDRLDKIAEHLDEEEE